MTGTMPTGGNTMATTKARSTKKPNSVGQRLEMKTQLAARRPANTHRDVVSTPLKIRGRGRPVER